MEDTWETFLKHFIFINREIETRIATAVTDTEAGSLELSAMMLQAVQGQRLPIAQGTSLNVSP